MMNADDVIHKFTKMRADSLEQLIIKKGELLDFFMGINDANPDHIVTDQLAMTITDLKELIDELLEIRKNEEFINDETQGVIDAMGNIKPISRESLIYNLKSKYFWQ